MKKELYFAWYMTKKNIQNSAELRTSFVTNVVGMVINNCAFIFLWIYFVKMVGIINGWTTMDIIGMQGVNAISYGIVISVLAGIGELPDYVSTGTFDRFILSPKNLLMRVATSSLTISAIGDTVFGVACLVIYGIFLKMSIIQVALMAMLVVAATAVFFSIMLIASSLSFFFIDSFCVTEGLFNLFFSPSLFHGGAFQGALRFIFTFLIPSLLIGALPVEIVKSISLPGFFLVVFLSLAWLFLSLIIFHRGAKRYESSNLITFGR